METTINNVPVKIEEITEYPFHNRLVFKVDTKQSVSFILKTLEADGLVKRTVYPQIPPKVEYELTPMGKSLMPHLHELAKWAVIIMEQIKASRSLHDNAVGRN